jgi:hypothetical protein
MGDLNDIERGQIVGARLVAASVTKSATLLAVTRATVCKVMSAYTNHGNISKDEHWAKINPNRKRKLSYIEKDC